MISVFDALNKIEKHTHCTTKICKVPLTKALNLVVAEDVVSSIHMPPFRQSAMDGYALNLHPTPNKHNLYTVVDEVQAGDSKNPRLQVGEAVRIFTGAAVPDDANAVVMQEKIIKTEKSNITLSHEIKDIKEGLNIRVLGEEIKAGTVALKKGTMLTPGAMGFLFSLGISKLKVFSRSTVALVETGNELQEANKKLDRGKVYGSNAQMLHAALQAIGYNDEEISTYKVKDDYLATKTLLENLIAKYNVVLITGGISVGDYDFVGKALKELGVEEVFYKVKQKPGKPLFFGIKNLDKKISGEPSKHKTSILALPGNPAAALTGFYIYVYPLLNLRMGAKQISLPKTTATCLSGFTKKGERAHFLKAILNSDGVEILEGQSSSMLYTFALANALVYLPETISQVKTGDKVEVICLPC